MKQMQRINVRNADSASSYVDQEVHMEPIPLKYKGTSYASVEELLNAFRTDNWEVFLKKMVGHCQGSIEMEDLVRHIPTFELYAVVADAVPTGTHGKTGITSIEDVFDGTVINRFWKLTELQPKFLESLTAKMYWYKSPQWTLKGDPKNIGLMHSDSFMASTGNRTYLCYVIRPWGHDVEAYNIGYDATAYLDFKEIASMD